ncbi:hypothetical protein ACJZ2D_014251 [Fusarium nematophilum]
MITEDSGSDLALDRASKWLAHCVEYDDECEPPDKSFKPRRLLWVGTSGDPFLVKPHEPVPYACLSYCWGPDVDDVLRTTRKSLQSHLMKIPVASLPAAIQDAITVSRGLKIAYLWVDSLCIVQDDQAEWLQEASLMSEIYLNSHLTIAAIEPASCKSHFLGMQRFGEPGWQRYATAKTSLAPDGSEVGFFIRPGMKEYFNQDERSSMDRRAWCLQESVMPNRRLCFNGNEMMWQCHCRQICECGHIKFTPDPTTKRGPSAVMKLRLSNPDPYTSGWQSLSSLHEEQQGHSFVEADQMHRKWLELVADYSRRKLSKQEDKLPAIMGLAKLVSTRLDGYKAGLWEREFHFGLAWRVVSFTPESGHTSVNRLRFPSWTWASVDDPVDYPLLEEVKNWAYAPELTDVCTVNSVVCKGTLLVSGGRAILTGPLAPVTRAFKEAYLHQVTCNPISMRSQQDFQIWLDQPTPEQAGHGWSDERPRGHGLAQEEEELFLFRLFSWVAYDCNKVFKEVTVLEGPLTWFLILKKTPTAELNFTRVGIGFWDGDRSRRPSIFDDARTATVTIL